MAQTGLNEFREVLSDFRQLSALATKALVVVPFADLWLKLGPPPSKIVASITSLIGFLALVFVFQFWHDAKANRLGAIMKASLILFFIGIMISLALLERFTVSPGHGQERVVEGLFIRSDVKPLIDSSFDNTKEALRASEYDAERVWTKSSIVTLQVLITIVWVVTFGSLVVYLGVFIILQRRRAVPGLVSPGRERKRSSARGR
jgi:hypothetical protein